MQLRSAIQLSPISAAALAAVVSSAAFLARAPHLQQYVTTDEDLTLARSGDFAEAVAEGRWARTYQIGHPEVTVMWITTLSLTPDWARAFGTGRPESGGLRKRSASDIESFMAALGRARLGMVVAHSLLVALCSALVWKLTGPVAGGLSGGFLALEPFLVAHGQLLRGDALMAELTLVSLLAALVYARGGTPIWALCLSAVAFGLALLTKTPAVLVAPVVGAVLLLSRQYRALLAWAAISAGISFLVWPALWVRPLETLDRVVDYTALKGGSPMDAGSFLLGTVAQDPGPLFYPVALLLRLSPVALAGLVALLWWRGGGARSLTLTLLAALGVTGAALILAPKKADRYVIPAVPVIATLAALGFTELTRRAGRLGRLAVPAIGLGSLAASIASVSPYPLAYYNPLLGGGATASRAILVGWGEGLDQVAAYLNQQDDAADQTVATTYPDALDAQFAGKVVPLAEYDVADVVVRYIAADQRDLTPPALQAALDQRAPDFEVAINGILYARVYRMPTPEFDDGITLEAIELDDRSVSRSDQVGLTIRWRDSPTTSQPWRTRVTLIRQDGQTAGETYGPWQTPTGTDGSARDERYDFPAPRALGRYTIALSLQRQADNALLSVVRRPAGVEPSPNQLILQSLWFRVQ